MSTLLSTADDFERALRAHKTPYCRIGDEFVFPDRCPEMRWIYLLDVNVTGRALHDRPIYTGDHVSGFLTVMGW